MRYIVSKEWPGETALIVAEDRMPMILEAGRGVCPRYIGHMREI